MEKLLDHIPEILILIFIAVTFLQSGFDKVFDWKGNTQWLQGHFEKTFMSGMVPFLVGVILVAEILSGLLAIAGILWLILYGEICVALAAMILASLTLLMLFFGQRVAKDYPGAFTITGYFLVVLFGIYLLSV